MSETRNEQEIKYEVFRGGPLLVGVWGPGPLPPPLKSGPDAATYKD